MLEHVLAEVVSQLGVVGVGVGEERRGRGGGWVVDVWVR